MSLLRTLIILLLIYFAFRTIIRLIAPGQKRRDYLNEGREQLHPCPACGTYNAAPVAFHANGGYYCSEQCYNQRGKKS